MQVMAFVVCGFGIFALVDGQSFTDLLDKVDDDSSIDLYVSAAVILVAISVIVIIITFFGCCGAIKVSFNIRLLPGQKCTVYDMLILQIPSLFRKIDACWALTLSSS